VKQDLLAHTIKHRPHNEHEQNIKLQAFGVVQLLCIVCGELKTTQIHPLMNAFPLKLLYWQIVSWEIVDLGEQVRISDVARMTRPDTRALGHR
jgi:hypothetical protein